MAARTILATLPGSAPYQRLQVGLEQRSDGRTRDERDVDGGDHDSANARPVIRGPFVEGALIEPPRGPSWKYQ